MTQTTILTAAVALHIAGLILSAVRADAKKQAKQKTSSAVDDIHAKDHAMRALLERHRAENPEQWK